MYKVGWHTSIKNLLEQPDWFFENHQTFQVFVGSPRTLKVPSFAQLDHLKQKRPNIDIVVHTPYVVSLCKNPAEKITQATMRYYIAMAKYLSQCNVKYMVTHIGGLSEGDTIKNGTLYIYDFCLKWLQATSDCNTILCLENDVGSRSGTKMGYIKILASIVKKINNPRIRMCYDCLPDRERIQLIDGSYMSVGDIWKKYNNGEKVYIKSYKDGQYVEKPIVYMTRRINDEYTYYINSCLGQMKCTGGHKVMTTRGPVKVEDLNNIDYIISNERGLTSKQKQVLYGTMAGDTCLGFTKNRIRLQLSQGDKQIEYLQLKKKIFESLGFCAQPVRSSYPYRKDGSEVISYKWCSHCNESLREIEDVCYQNGKRFFSKEWSDKITPLSLAFWFYDDGNLSLRKSKSGNEYRYAAFNVQKFTDEEADNFVEMMHRFNIEGRMAKYERGYSFYCSKAGTDRLMDLIHPYLYTQDMAYKHKNPEISEWVDNEVSPLGLVRVSVSRKETGQRDKYVYDFEVEDTHTYFCHNYYVHNCEHAYGAGFDITSEEKLDILNNFVSVVHYNAIPSFVESGSHLDRHSTTSLDESKVDEFIIYQKLYDGVRPFIFEVDGEPYISRNLDWLNNKIKER